MKPVQVFLLSAALATAPAAASAQNTTPASSGVYTSQQSTRGAALYQSKCASCHGDDLAGGGTSPALAGSDFAVSWSGRSVAALFASIRASMPQDQPGTLSAQQTADLIAFLLKANKFPEGKTELPSESDRLKQILIDSAP